MISKSEQMVINHSELPCHIITQWDPWKNFDGELSSLTTHDQIYLAFVSHSDPKLYLCIVTRSLNNLTILLELTYLH